MLYVVILTQSLSFSSHRANKKYVEIKYKRFAVLCLIALLATVIHYVTAIVYLYRFYITIQQTLAYQVISKTSFCPCFDSILLIRKYGNKKKQQWKINFNSMIDIISDHRLAIQRIRSYVRIQNNYLTGWEIFSWERFILRYCIKRSLRWIQVG